jgi:hypothetical protein
LFILKLIHMAIIHTCISLPLGMQVWFDYMNKTTWHHLFIKLLLGFVKFILHLNYVTMLHYSFHHFLWFCLNHNTNQFTIPMTQKSKVKINHANIDRCNLISHSHLKCSFTFFLFVLAHVVENIVILVLLSDINFQYFLSKINVVSFNFPCSFHFIFHSYMSQMKDLKSWIILFIECMLFQIVNHSFKSLFKLSFKIYI